MNDHDAVDLLEELVRIPSVSRGEAAAARFFAERAASLGFDAQIDAAGNPVATIGGRGPRLVLLGHIDTVPGDVPVRREGGKLYGRGSVDAKGPLATFLVAAARAHSSGQLAHRIEVVGCVEEEISSSRGAHFRSTLEAPDACIVGEPSGWDGITVGYKGFLRATMRARAPLGHSAGPQRNLAADACRAWVGLERAAASLTPGDAPLFDRLLTHLESIRHSSDALQEQVELDAKLRLPPSLTPGRTGEWLGEQFDGWEVAIEGGVPAWRAPRTTVLAKGLARSIRTAGGRARFIRKTGTADTNVLAPAWGCPMVAYGPGDSQLDHTPQEHIEVEDFVRSVGILVSALQAPLA